MNKLEIAICLFPSPKRFCSFAGILLLIFIETTIFLAISLIVLALAAI